MNNKNMSNGSKADCFAFRDLNRKGDCIALNDLYCKNGERCSFYKKKRKRRKLKMIRLDVKPWCENCNEFEAEVSKLDYEDFQDNRVTDTVIKCAHAQRCESIRKYLAEKGE